jgi:hypothetical protein
MLREIHTSSGIRTAIPIFKRAEALHASYSTANEIRPYIFNIRNYLSVLSNYIITSVFVVVKLLTYFLRGNELSFGEYHMLRAYIKQPKVVYQL